MLPEVVLAVLLISKRSFCVYKRDQFLTKITQVDNNQRKSSLVWPALPKWLYISCSLFGCNFLLNQKDINENIFHKYKYIYMEAI